MTTSKPLTALSIATVLLSATAWADTPQSSITSDAPRAAIAAPVLGPVLYDQTMDIGFSGIASQDFEALNDNSDSVAADDFSVPLGQTWSIEQVFVAGAYTVGPAESVNVAFYADAGGLPGAVLASFTGVLPTDIAGDFEIDLPSTVVLGTGTYWLSVQTRQDVDPNGQWFWTENATLHGHESVWMNPNDGFGTGCTDWAPRASTCGVGSDPDLLFSLHGSSTGCPTDTAICTEGDKGKLKIKDGKRMKWAWKGPLSIGDIGDPSMTDSLTHCIKVDDTTVYAAEVPAGIGKLVADKKYLFSAKKDGPADGIKKARVKNGKPGKANGKIAIKTDGTNQPAQPIGGTTVESILASSTGACYKSTFTTADDVKKDDETTFKAKVKK